MAELTPAEQLELQALEAELGETLTYPALTEAEQVELDMLEQEEAAGWPEPAQLTSPTPQQAPAPLTPAETAEMQALAEELGQPIEQPQPESGDIGKGLVTGIKGALIPFAVTEEDYQGLDTTDTITSVVTNIAGGIATTAAIGAGVAAAATAAGVTASATAVAAISAGIYGLYAGIGGEVSRSEMEGQDFSWERAAAISAMEINSVVKGGKAMLVFLRTAAQAATSREVEKSYGTTDNTALNVATGVGMLSMAGPMLSRTKKVKPKEAAELADWFGDPEVNIKMKTKEAFDKADRTIDVDDIEFKQSVIGKKVDSKKELDRQFRQRWSRLDDGLKQDAMDAHVWAREQMKIGAEEAQKMYNAGKIVSDPLVPGLQHIEDMKYTARRVDDALGTGFEKNINDMSTAEMAVANKIGPALKRAAKLRKEGEQLGIDGEDIGRWLDGSHTKPMPDSAKELVGKWRQMYDIEQAKFKPKGYDIGYLDNYMNMKLLEPVDLHLAMKRELNYFKGLDLIDDTGASVEKNIKNNWRKAGWSKEQYTDTMRRWVELKRVSRSLTGKPITSKNAFQNIKVGVDKALEANVKKGTEYSLDVMFERGGKLPEQFRNFDVHSNFLGYITSNHKALEFEKPMRELANNIVSLEKMGMDNSARYWSDYLKHMSGQESGAKAWYASRMNKLRASARESMRNPDSPLYEKLPAKTAVGVADFLNWTSGLAYQNLLGMNVRAPLRNMTQSIVETAPHIGYKYGSKIVANGWKHLVKRTDGNIKEFLISKNLITSGMEELKEARGAIADGMRQSGALVGRARKYSDRFAEISLSAYQKSDQLNRYITYKAGQQWAKDILAGDTAAIQAMSRLGRGNKVEIMTKSLMKDEEALGDFLGRTLVSDTQFQYGKSQMHQFGRKNGKIFSMFTKWPSIKMSELAYALSNRKENLKPTLMKMAIPYSLYAAAQIAREDAGPDPMSVYLLGKDLKSNAPASSINPSAFDLTGGPVLSTAGRIAGSAARATVDPSDENIENIWGAVDKAVEVFNPIPGQNIINEINRIGKAHGDEPIMKIKD